MSTFHSHPVVREVDGSRWEVVEPLVYDSDLLGLTVIVPAGFITDFYSIPRWLPLAYALLSGERKGPALVHDFGYQTHMWGRATTDSLLLEAMRASSVPSWKAWPIYLGVRAGGFVAWQDHARRGADLNPEWTAQQALGFGSVRQES